MTILIVDDAADNRHLLRALLKRGGYADTRAFESATALFADLRVDSADATAPSDVDLILMDLMMPKISGIEACREIRQSAHLKDIPIIMVTACTEMESLQDSFDAGAIDYITKPVRRVELLARVRCVLAMKQEMNCRKARERELLEIRSQLEEANAELTRLSVEDALTGISNRRVFDERLENEWRRAERERSLLSLALIDIDQFKIYNDSYGHQKGDECLRAVAQTLEGNVRRPADLAARYGGEEFGIVLPRTDSFGAAVVSEKLRRSVAGLKIPHGGSSIGEHVTISLGCATIKPGPGATPADLVKAADAALYESKSDGRNRCTSADLTVPA